MVLHIEVGIGGGSASSRSDIKKLIYQIQRGDPEMENKLNRVIRACVSGDHNPIRSIHVKEQVEWVM